MLMQTGWGNKAQSRDHANFRQASAEVVHAGSPTLQRLSFYLAFSLLAIPLTWLLPASFQSLGVAWRWEYALWAAVPVSCITVAGRHLARKHFSRDAGLGPLS